MSYYDDIINLPHHVSTKHPRMSMYNRAAQFSPFAALTGYEKAIEEARKKQEAEVRRRNTLYPLSYGTIRQLFFSTFCFVFIEVTSH